MVAVIHSFNKYYTTRAQGQKTFKLVRSNTASLFILRELIREWMVIVPA